MAKIICIVREWGEGRRPGFLRPGLLVIINRHESNSQMLLIPMTQARRIFRAEEQTSNSSDVLHIVLANDPSSGAQHPLCGAVDLLSWLRTGRNDCNQDAPAGFAAMQGLVDGLSFLAYSPRRNELRNTPTGKQDAHNQKKVTPLAACAARNTKNSENEERETE
jgi:hypothetical protein